MRSQSIDSGRRTSNFELPFREAFQARPQPCSAANPDEVILPACSFYRLVSIHAETTNRTLESASKVHGCPFFRNDSPGCVYGLLGQCQATTHELRLDRAERTSAGATLPYACKDRQPGSVA